MQNDQIKEDGIINVARTYMKKNKFKSLSENLKGRGHLRIPRFDEG
jgi:hypothetical protein